MIKFMLFSRCPCREEAGELLENGVLNGMFVLGRSMGFIGKLTRSY